MKSHLFKVKQMGVLLLLAGLAWLAAVSEIETIFGLGLSVQSAVLLLTFRWYGRAAGVSLAVAASLHHYIFLHNALAAILCLAVILFAAACQKWIEGKGLLPFAVAFWIGIGPALTAGVYYATLGRMQTELGPVLFHYAGNGIVNALLAELIFCYLPWKPNGGWQRANIGFTFKQLWFHVFAAAVLFPFFLLVAVVGIFHNDEYEKDAQRLSENVFRLMDYELSSWEEQDIGLLRLNALVQISRLDGIAHSLSEAAGVDMIVETEERQLLSTTVPENMILREQWRSGNRTVASLPAFSVWLSHGRGGLPVADWSDGYYAYEAALEELPVRITVLVPTGHYLQRLQQMYAMFFGALIGLAVIAVAAGYGFGRWLTGELQGVARIMTQLLRQRDESETVAMPISPVVEIRGLAVHCREVLVRFAARLRELKHVNQTLESQAKKLRKSKAYWEHMACHDPLTGLRNRLYFADALDRLIMEQYGSRMSVGVIFMDLDDFKFINDCYGHAAGDELLKQVAERLRQAVNKGSICRLGGDEFVVLVPSTDPAELERLSQQIVSALQRPFPVHSQSCT